MRQLAKSDKNDQNWQKLINLENFDKIGKKWHTFYLTKFLPYNELLKIEIQENFQYRN